MLRFTQHDTSCLVFHSIHREEKTALAVKPPAPFSFFAVVLARAGQFAFLVALAAAHGATIAGIFTAEAAKAEFALFPDHQQHAGVEDGRVGTAEDTDQQGKREIVDAASG